jgi:hypothetical protein
MEQVKNKIPYLQLSLSSCPRASPRWLALFGELANSQLDRYDWSGKFSNSRSRVLCAVANASSTWRKSCRDTDCRDNTLGSSQCGLTTRRRRGTTHRTRLMSVNTSGPLTLREGFLWSEMRGFRRSVDQLLSSTDVLLSRQVSLSVLPSDTITETSNGKAGDGPGGAFRSNLTETTETSGGTCGGRTTLRRHRLSHSAC